MKNPPAVAVAILTYNSAQIIERCLRSLLQLRYPAVSWLVVDNHSSDDTVEIVNNSFPQVRLLQTGWNAGYAGGNNAGIEQALKERSEYVLILNPDVVLKNPEFLNVMVDYLEQHPAVGILGPRVFLRTADCVQNTILFPPGLWRNAVHWIRYRLDNRFAQLSGDEELPAHMLNGVCVLLRAACLRQVGLFDESIFMYIEDADLAYRARLAGWEIRYLPVDSVIHEQKEEGYHETGFVAWLLKRNSVYFLHKTGQYFEAIGYASMSLLLMALKCLRQRLRPAYLLFTWDLLTGFVAVLAGQASGRRFVRPSE